ncbi:hypothetical protein [Clostridium nigeriense]|uniref:hypothetical protein n=1 Tax=Clostridium nigeriense TaxID=1805470 RepID=UPI0008361C1F|nr:hypothetical protein [Clostridium nigeriense]
MKKIISFSNSIFIIAIAIFLYGIYKIYTIRKNLPIGACPIDDNRPILYLSIILMILSIIVSYVEDRKLKRM